MKLKPKHFVRPILEICNLHDVWKLGISYIVPNNYHPFSIIYVEYTRDWISILGVEMHVYWYQHNCFEWPWVQKLGSHPRHRWQPTLVRCSNFNSPAVNDASVAWTRPCCGTIIETITFKCGRGHIAVRWGVTFSIQLRYITTILDLGHYGILCYNTCSSSDNLNKLSCIPRSKPLFCRLLCSISVHQC